MAVNKGGYLTKEVLNDLNVIFDDDTKAKEKHAASSVNWPHAVLLVSFVDGLGEDLVWMEEANESELE